MSDTMPACFRKGADQPAMEEIPVPTIQALTLDAMK